jgi:hypothetical protein
MFQLIAFMALFSPALLTAAEEGGVEMSPVRVVVIGGGAAGELEVRMRQGRV